MKPLEIGAAAPDFELADLDGTPHRLSSYREAKAIVLALTGAGCPMARAYAPRLAKIASEYKEKGVQVLALSSNSQDNVEKLRSFAHELQITFPVLKDQGNVVADRLGAARTCEVFLFDAAFALRYHGRVDDQYAITDRSVGLQKSRPEANYLRDAIEAVLAKKEVPVARTEPSGCVIGREQKPSSAAGVTFHGDVEKILQKSCQPCHREGQIAPFPLMTFEDAAGWSGMIREVVESRRMPPWHADPRHGTFSNQRSLPAGERDLLMRWVDAGSPRGDPALRPAPAVFPGEWQIGEPDAVFEMATAFRVPAEGKVKYQYFTVETGFEDERWVQAMEVRPGARDVVHHILVFAQDPRDPERWKRESGGGTSGYFAAMVPGERPIVYADGMAKRLPARSTLVFQIHYTTNGAAREDRSRIGLVFARKPVKREVHTRSAVARELRIPAGAERHEVKSFHTFSKPTRILSYLPHMHIRGSAFLYEAHYPARVKVSKDPWSGHFPESVVRRLRHDADDGALVWLGKLEAEAFDALAAYYDGAEDRSALETLRAAGKSEILLSVPAYDFGWQSNYRLAEPKLVPAGTLLECTATYNNSRSNFALTEDMWTKPVRWGDQTWQEMMIGYFDCVAAGG